MILLFFCVLFSGVSEASLRVWHLENLRLDKIYVIDGSGVLPERPDLSGLATDGERLFTVSDKGGQHDIYLIDVNEAATTARLSIYKSFPEKWLKAYEQKHSDYGRIDFEGISYCSDGSFYLVDERSRRILRWTEEGAVEIDPGFDAFHKRHATMNPFSGMPNSGLEAIAVDCAGKRAYIFNERQFRMGYIFDLAEGRMLDQFDYPSDPSLPLRFMNTYMYADFAGAFFQDGFLYILERNARQIVKYDPDNFQVLKRWELPGKIDELYETDYPFGLAEGLAIKDGFFYVVLDNNEFTLKGRPGDSSAVLLKLSPYTGF
jgi:hypothetical protein